MKKILIILMLSSILFAGCKDNLDDKLNAVYLFRVEGLTAHFENYSDNAIQYTWDFGDNSEQSIEKNPSHTYSQKGNFTVALKATGVDGNIDTFEDVVTIYGPSIRIDGEFSDWKDVQFIEQNIANADGVITRIKTWAEMEKVNWYIEGTVGLADIKQIEIFINSDNDHKTGWATGHLAYEGSGIELTLSGGFAGIATSPWLGKHSASGQEWGNTGISGMSSEVRFSNLTKVENGYAFEFSISKELLKTSLKTGSTLGDGITFNIHVYDGGWGVLGSAPRIWSKFWQIPILF